ncbi:Uncharacterised protein [Acinetobacter baumannii]|nr:Uncharacterised protein [Acinetobacter baumannii]SSM72686.1 Uncharacterised protein [Acinetobacter baumannii]SSO68916.1 Uncharacterised protein [Acinetobacter baumannii]SSO69406.1 Uncharacterised protein [Acinetobacter baumannii]SSO93580.1 Uncharacterised protein [Acinetobacter baumannii]
MENWLYLYIEHTVKNGKPFYKKLAGRFVDKVSDSL